MSYKFNALYVEHLVEMYCPDAVVMLTKQYEDVVLMRVRHWLGVSEYLDDIADMCDASYSVFYNDVDDSMDVLLVHKDEEDES